MKPWTFYVTHLRALEAIRWPGYVEDIRRCAISFDDHAITVDSDGDCFKSLYDKRFQHEVIRAEQEVVAQKIDRAQAVERADAMCAVFCNGCQHYTGRSVSRLVVLCAEKKRGCSCPNGEVSMISGACPLKMWDAKQIAA